MLDLDFVDCVTRVEQGLSLHYQVQHRFILRGHTGASRVYLDPMATKDKEKVEELILVPHISKPSQKISFQAESAAAAPAPPEDEGVLREKIKGQVEYYLSRQNLLQVFRGKVGWQLF